MDPINYTSAFADLPSPSASFMQGVGNGATLQALQAQQQAQQAAQAQQQQQAQVIGSLANNPNATADDVARASLLVPQFSAQLKQFWDMKNTAQQKANLQQIGGWTAAVQAGQPEIASKGMREQADAIENTAGGPTQESQGLRAKADQVDANPKAAGAVLKMMLIAHPDGKQVIENIAAANKDQRDQDEAPAALRKANAGADTAEADATAKNLGIIGQQAGALAQVQGVKPTQAQAMFKSLAARGVIGKDQLQGYLDGIPADPAALRDYLKQVQASGMKPDDQMKYTAPDANTVANNRTSLAVQDRIDKRDKENREAKDSGVDQTQVENVAQLIADGRMAPLGAMAMRTSYGQAVMSRVAEINPSYRAQDFGTSSKAEKDFATGKQGNAVRSFNVGLSHLDTLGQLADAMGNKDTQAINRIGNYFATQTGAEAPVKFEAAKKVVTDEIVKAIVGAGGTGHDREEAAKTIAAASSPAQLRGVINTYKELMVGQLGGLEQQYRTTTGRDDFHRYLSPQALALYGKHGGAAAPSAGPAVGTIDGGFRFKGGDPSQKSSWEPVR